MEKGIEGKVTEIFDEFLSVDFEMEAPKVESKQLHVYFALDRSGSMSGDKISTAREAINSLINLLKEDQVTMTLIAYDDRAEFQDSREITTGNAYESLIKYCNSIDARGGTTFVSAFEVLEKQMTKFKDQNNVIIFITDGQDGSGAERLNNTMQHLQNFMKENQYKGCLHAIGVGRDHDANLLTSMIKYGTSQGTFQYVENSKAIQEAVANLQGVMEVSSSWGILKVGKEVEYRVAFDIVEETPLSEEEVKLVPEKKMKGSAFITDFDSKQDLNLEVHIGKVTKLHSVKLVKNSEPLSITKLGDFVRQKVVAIIDVLRRGKVLEIERSQFVKLIEKIDGKVDGMMEEIRKMDTMKRKKLMPGCLDLKELTGEFYNALKIDLTTRGLENVALAKLNDVVYRGVLKKGLAKKLNKRYEQNVGLMENVDTEIEKIVKGFKVEELKKKYSADSKTLEDEGYCLLSCKNWMEALLDYDCICATFHVERSPAAIADPSQVVIKSVNTTQLTSESFMTSALYLKSKADEVDYNSPSFTKGQPADTLVKGLPNEVITGLLPLYINEDHWKIARLKMKPLLGWTATLDVMGYMPSQLITIPFLLFAKIAEDLSSDFQKKIFEQIKQTCRAIYVQFKKTILPDLEAKIAKYVEDPLLRTIDSIAHNQVFLTHLYFAMVEKDLKVEMPAVIHSLMPHLYEEEIRRRTYNDVADPITFILEMVGASKAELIDSYGISLDKIENLEEAKQDPMVGLDKIDGVLKVLTPEAEARRKKFESYFEKGTHLFTFSQLFKLFGVEPYISLTTMGIDTNEKIVAFIIQTLLHHKNSDRREAIEKKEYICPFIQKYAQEFVKKKFVGTVVEERKRKDAEARAVFLKSAGKLMAAKFALTDSLESAVKILEAIAVNSVAYGEIIHYFITHPVKHPLEKAHMLIDREFNGTKLLRKGKKDVLPWNHSKRNAFRIWRMNRGEVADVAAWQKLFPTFADRITHWEERWQKGIIKKYLMKKYK